MTRERLSEIVAAFRRHKPKLEEKNLWPMFEELVVAVAGQQSEADGDCGVHPRVTGWANTAGWEW